MTILPHVVAGAAVGSFVPNIPLAVAGGFVSHIVLDLIPHWDPTLSRSIPRWRKILYGLLFLLDLTLSLSFLYFILDHPPAFWAGLTGALVDLDSFYFHKLQKAGIKIHVDEEGGWHRQTNLWLGLFNQSWVTLVGILTALINLGKLHF